MNATRISGTGKYYRSKFKVGDRFAYRATGYAGNVLAINATAGTVDVDYDPSSIGGNRSKHTLAEHVLVNLSRASSLDDSEYNQGYIAGHDAAFKSLLADQIREVAGSLKPGLFIDGVEQNVVQPSGEQTRTNQLLNELYHDRSRLENVIKGAAKLFAEAIDGYEWESDEAADQWRGAAKQFIADHE